jgi:hypothetical protein
MASTTSPQATGTPSHVLIDRIDRELPQVNSLIWALLNEFPPDGPHPDTYEGLRLTALQQRRYLLLIDRERYETDGDPAPFARIPQDDDEGGF